ncbi:MAG: hypothetical protein AAF614_17685, partial [Chloroflexota bacterium]
MRQKFEWQTDEDEGWDVLPAPTPLPASPFRSHKIFLIIIVGLAIVGGVGYWQAQRRVVAVEAAIQQDVVSSHILFQRAAEEGDVDLLKTVLSGENGGWLAEQFSLLQRELLADRWALGLQVSRNAGELVSIGISPTLTEAEVVWQRPFLADWHNGEEVMLPLGCFPRSPKAVVKGGLQPTLFSLAINGRLL